MTTTEVWKPVKGYEGLYEASDTGRVKSLGKFNAWANGQTRFIPREKYLRQKFTRYGYFCVTLQTKKQPKTFFVHRLVAEAFIPNPENKKQVNHKDYNRTNNNVENLEWMTAKENYNYSLCNMPSERRVKRKHSTGCKYVTYHKSKNAYQVVFKDKYIGTYKTFDEAKKVRDKVVEDYEKANPSEG